ncbi:MAG TPA: diguanylate cyclase [Cyanobacteria bacterium UBA8803]|nr:diguanylate cyclase [Cyanobacteria bacterium UBA9273]HBL59345.1 diguanylate cyclase [Cyanobacteria bacterium UBA8803]
MSDRKQSRKELIAQLASLRQEVAKHKMATIALEAQNELLRTFVATVKATTGSLMIKALLQQTLQIAIRLTTAQESSLFLLNTEGRVIESILARGALIRDLKQNLIGQVLDKGLAGWAIRHRQVGLIADTMNDDRWLQLANQPYTVRSALCLPILRGKILLGVITLMHSEPGHFSLESAHLMQMATEHMALVLENALLYTEHQLSEPQMLQKEEPPPPEPEPYPIQPEEPLFNREELSVFGIYMMIAYGKFLYVNPRMAEIFGYSLDELLSLESIFELVTVDSCGLVTKHMERCLQSQNKCLSCTFKGQRKDGSLIDVEVYGKNTTFAGKSVVIGILRPV